VSSNKQQALQAKRAMMSLATPQTNLKPFYKSRPCSSSSSSSVPHFSASRLEALPKTKQQTFQTPVLATACCSSSCNLA
jgi:hypothetical protein